MVIKDIMTKDVITLNENDTVERAAKLISENDISGLPVLNTQSEIIGIVTEGDLIKRAAKVDGPAYLEVLGGVIYLESVKDFMKDVLRAKGNYVKEIMTKDLITILDTQDMEEAANIMVKKKINRLPVVNKSGNLVGIVSRRDIMNSLFN